MKTSSIILIVFIFLSSPIKVLAQNNNSTAAVVAAGAVAAGLGTLLAIDNLEEQVELMATQKILSMQPELPNFTLKVLNFEGTKAKDMSNVSVMAFKIQEFTPADGRRLLGDKRVLLAFTSSGWMNQYGLDYNKVQWYLLDKSEWINLMAAYTKMASVQKNEEILKESITKGVVVNKGIRIEGKLVVPFYKLDNDMYISFDYSDTMKLVYNEKSFGIYLKNTHDLVQIRRTTIIDIHSFLLDNGQ
jgi:hypothetical protein